MISKDPLTPLNTTTVVCRPALPADKASMLELTRTIWEGHDYVPSVWDKWMKDTIGLLAVVEFGGRVAGLGKLTCLAPGEWWLEGLRVDPQLEGQKIGSHLHDYLSAVWQRKQAGNSKSVLRLATASTRFAVHKMCARTGFYKIGELSDFSAPLPDGSTAGGKLSKSEAADEFERLDPDEAEQAAGFALKSPALPLQFGLMNIFWRWASPNADFLRRAACHQHAFWWRGRSGLLAFYEDDDEDGKSYPLLQIIACSLEDLPALLSGYRRLAAGLGYTAARWDAPLHPDLQPALAEAGFKRDWEEALFLFEKKM